MRLFAIAVISNSVSCAAMYAGKYAPDGMSLTLNIFLGIGAICLLFMPNYKNL